MDNVWTMSNVPKQCSQNGGNVSPDLERQLFRLSPTIVDGGDPMWKLKLVKEEETTIKNICSLAEGRVNGGGGEGGSSLTVYLL